MPGESERFIMASVSPTYPIMEKEKQVPVSASAPLKFPNIVNLMGVQLHMRLTHEKDSFFHR